MSFTIKNQTPGRIDSLDVPCPLTAVTDEYQLPVVLERLVNARLLTPISASSPVIVSETDAHGVVTSLDAPAIAGILAEAIASDTPAANARALSLLSELSAVTITPDWPYLRHMFVAQSASEHRSPAPGPRVIYNAADDVIPPARDLISIAGSTDYAKGTLAWRSLLAGLGSAFTPAVLGVGVLTADDFATFTQTALANARALNSAGKVTDETLKKFTALAATGLEELTEGLILRKTGEPTDDYSFARLLHQQIIAHARSVDATARKDDALPRFVMMPFDIEQMTCPTIVVFANVEHHARAQPRAVTREWNAVAATAASPITMVSTKTLNKLNSASKRLDSHRNMVRSKEKGRQTQRRAPIAGDFAADAPPPKQAIEDVVKYLRRMEQVNHSQNVIRFRKKSFTRASRRRPEDPNVPGRSVGNRFYPDLHIYADTSGSISEGDYRNSVMLAAKLAKKLDVNLYFSSHSHVLSSETLIPTKGRSIPAIMDMFAKIPKVDGGNRFEVVYNYIQASPVRRRRLNVITTDFGWAPNSLSTFTHPENLVYIPVWDRSRPQGWEGVKRQAVTLVEELRRFDANIDHKFLGMGYTPPPRS